MWQFDTSFRISPLSFVIQGKAPHEGFVRFRKIILVAVMSFPTGDNGGTPYFCENSAKLTINKINILQSALIFRQKENAAFRNGAFSERLY